MLNNLNDSSYKHQKTIPYQLWSKYCFPTLGRRLIFNSIKTKVIENVNQYFEQLPLKLK